jgi:hypothetical protein
MLQDEIRRLQALQEHKAMAALRERVESRLHAELQDFLQWAEGEHKARSKDGNDVTSSTAATETAKAKRSTEPDASAKITKTKKYKKSKKSKAHTTTSWSRSGKNYLLTCAHVDADKVPEGVRVETFADATVRACVDVDEYAGTIQVVNYNQSVEGLYCHHLRPGLSNTALQYLMLRPDADLYGSTQCESMSTTNTVSSDGQGTSKYTCPGPASTNARLPLVSVWASSGRPGVKSPTSIVAVARMGDRDLAD